MTGIVFRIQRYSIHDGPGIRTAVFLKGCPLKCWWCHNPEGQELPAAVVYHKNSCMHCKRCAGICSSGAIYFDEWGPVVNKGMCSGCSKCVNVCRCGALELIGRKISAVQLMEEVEKDVIFFDESGGGVTFTGGEPFLQFGFLFELLVDCKAKGIHTAVETSGYIAWDKLETASENIGMFLYDLKLMDDEKHIKYTGVSNRLILDNLIKLSALHHDIHVRIPLIPGVNDDSENIEKTCLFLKTTKVKNVSILPYHKAGIYKYHQLGLSYQLEGIDTPGSDEIEVIAGKFKDNGFSVKIGG